MKRLARIGAALMAVLLSGCSWLGSDDEQLEPAPLPEFTAELEVRPLWSAKVGAGLGEKYILLVPLVAENAVFASDVEGAVSAFDRVTGKRLWIRDLDVTVTAGVGGSDRRLFLATQSGRLIALSAESGDTLWEARLPSEALSAPQSNGDVVMVQTIDGRLSAFDAGSGERLWTYSSRQPNLSLRGTGTPMLTQSVTIAGFDNGYLTALDNRTGEELWSRRIALAQGQTELERVVDLDGSVLEENGVLYVTSFQGRIAAVAAQSGQVLWSKPLSSYHGLAAEDRVLFASDAEGHVQAFDQGSGASLWKQDELARRRLSPPAVLDGLVAVADYEGYVHFLSQQDGRFVARYRADSDGVRSRMIGRDHELYILGNGGRLVALTLPQ